MIKSNIDTSATTKPEEVWTTKDGIQIPFSQITHSHWSNIYWYHRYILESLEKTRNHYSNKAVLTTAIVFIEIAEEQINLRFGGKILDWVPMYPNEKGWYKKQNGTVHNGQRRW